MSVCVRCWQGRLLRFRLDSEARDVGMHELDDRPVDDHWPQCDVPGENKFKHMKGSTER